MKAPFHGALVSVWNRKSSVSLGPFIFITHQAVRDEENLNNPQSSFLRKLIAHEYGHTIQSLILGPFYLFVIGIPSAIWANSKRVAARRTRGTVSYYQFYTERWANHLSKRFMGFDTPKV